MRSALAQITAELMTEYHCDREPYCLFGHSMGAYFALEAAYRMQQFYARQPELLFISGQSSPVHIQNEYYDADEDRFRKYIMSLGGIDPILMHDERTLEFLLAPVRQDLRLLAQYHPQVRSIRLQSDIAVMYGIEDEEIIAEELDSWNNVTSGKVTVQAFEGNHFYLLQQSKAAEYILNQLKEKAEKHDESEKIILGSQCAVAGNTGKETSDRKPHIR
jgi:surfactin synthase thioesterase subunit